MELSGVPTARRPGDWCLSSGRRERGGRKRNDNEHNERYGTYMQSMYNFQLAKRKASRTRQKHDNPENDFEDDDTGVEYAYLCDSVGPISNHDLFDEEVAEGRKEDGVR